LSLTSHCATAQLFVVGRIFIDDKDNEKEKDNKEKEKEKNKIVKREALWFDIIYNTNCSVEKVVHNAMR